jgi:hypothetical protein
MDVTLNSPSFFAGAISFDEEYIAAVDRGSVGIFNLKQAFSNSNELLPLESTAAAQRSRIVDEKIRINIMSPTFQIPICTKRTTSGQRAGKCVDVDRSNSIRSVSSPDDNVRDLKWCPDHIRNGRLLAIAHANSIDIWQMADMKSEKRDHNHYSEGSSSDTREIDEQNTANNEEVIRTNRGNHGPKLMKNIELFWPNSSGSGSSSCSTFSIDKSLVGSVSDTPINMKTSEPECESEFKSEYENDNTIHPARRSNTVSGERYLIKSISWHMCDVTSLIVFSTVRDPIKVEISSDFKDVQTYPLFDSVGRRWRERESSSHPYVPSISCGATESNPAIGGLGKRSEQSINNSNGINNSNRNGINVNSSGINNSNRNGINVNSNGINNSKSNGINSDSESNSSSNSSSNTNSFGIDENTSDTTFSPFSSAPSNNHDISLIDSTAMSASSHIESTGDFRGTESSTAISGIKSKIRPFGSVSKRSSLVACVDRNGVVTVVLEPLSDPVSTVKSKDRLEGSRGREVKATCLSYDDRLVFVSSSISSPPSSSFLNLSSASPLLSRDTISFTDLHCAVSAARPHTGLSTRSHTRFRHILAGDSLSSALYVPGPGPGVSSSPLLSGSDTDTAPMSLVRPSIPVTLIPLTPPQASRDLKRWSGADCDDTHSRMESERGPGLATTPPSMEEGEGETPSCTDSNRLIYGEWVKNNSFNAIDSHSGCEPAVICVGSQRGVLGVLDSLLSIRLDYSEEGDGDEDQEGSRGGRKNSDCLSDSAVDRNSSDRRRGGSNTTRIADVTLLPTGAPPSLPPLPPSLPPSLPLSPSPCITPAVILPCSLNGNGRVRNSTHTGTHTGMNSHTGTQTGKKTGPCSAQLPVCGEVVVHLLRSIEAVDIFCRSSIDSSSDTGSANSSSSSDIQQDNNTDSTKSSSRSKSSRSSNNSKSCSDLIEICRVSITDPLLALPDLLECHVLSSPQLIAPSPLPNSSSSPSSSTYPLSSLQSLSSSFQPSSSSFQPSASSFSSSSSSSSSFSSSSSSSSSLISSPCAIIGLLAVASTQSRRVAVYSLAAGGDRITYSCIGQYLVGSGQVKVM